MKHLLLLFLLFTCRSTMAQQDRIIIPFTLTSFNNISIKAIINTKDTVQLMFHTAANEVTIIESAAREMKTLQFDQTVDSIKSWGGAANRSRVSHANLLQIGDLSWQNVSITENQNSGQFTQGKFGIDLFKDKVMEIDFDRKVIVISNAMPDHVMGYTKLEMRFEQDMMFIEACSKFTNSPCSNRKFLLHSGYSGSLLLDDDYVKENELDKKLKITEEKELKDAFGNVLKTQKAILPSFRLGNTEFEDLPIGFFSGALGRQKMSIMGGDMIKRFNWIIDADRKFAYIKQNGLTRSPH